MVNRLASCCKLERRLREFKLLPDFNLLLYRPIVVFKKEINTRIDFSVSVATAVDNQIKVPAFLIE